MLIVKVVLLVIVRLFRRACDQSLSLALLVTV